MSGQQKRKQDDHNDQLRSKKSRSSGANGGNRPDSGIPDDFYTKMSEHRTTQCPIKTVPINRDKLDKDFLSFIKSRENAGHFVPGLIKATLMSASIVGQVPGEELSRVYVTSRRSFNNPPNFTLGAFYDTARSSACEKIKSDARLDDVELPNAIKMFWELVGEEEFFHVNDYRENGMDRKGAGNWFFESLKSLLDNMSHFTESTWTSTSVMHFGTIFSHFPVQKGDASMYSIHVNLWGKSKFWGAVPQYHAPKLEKFVEEKFAIVIGHKQTCRDFLSHKKALIHPYELHKAGIDCDWVEQKQGQIIITSPCGYYFGFDAGDNISQTVNFASLDCIPFGLVSRMDIGCTLSPSSTQSVRLNFRYLLKYYQHTMYTDYIEGRLTIPDPFESSLAQLEQRSKSAEGNKTKGDIPMVAVQLGPYGSFEDTYFRFVSLPFDEILAIREYELLIEDICHASIDTTTHHYSIVKRAAKLILVMEKMKESEHMLVLGMTTFTQIVKHSYTLFLQHVDVQLGERLFGLCQDVLNSATMQKAQYVALKLLAALRSKKCLPPNEIVTGTFLHTLSLLDHSKFMFRNIYIRGFMDEWARDLDTTCEYTRLLAAFDFANIFTTLNWEANPVLMPQRGDYILVQVIHDWREKNKSAKETLNSAKSTDLIETKEYLRIARHAWNVVMPAEARQELSKNKASLLEAEFFFNTSADGANDAIFPSTEPETGDKTANASLSHNELMEDEVLCSSPVDFEGEGDYRSKSGADDSRHQIRRSLAKNNNNAGRKQIGQPTPSSQTCDVCKQTFSKPSNLRKHKQSYCQ